MIYILLSTYNGEKYLEEQLESLINQKGVEFKILVRDDGSNDGTIDILNKWQKKGLLEWYSGKNVGSMKSFMDLLKTAPESDYYAFCDQDDIWLPYKLSKSLENIRKFREDIPSLVCSDLTVVDRSLNVIHTSMWEYMKLRPHLLVKLKYAMSCNLFTGCTMMINKYAREIVFPISSNAIMHDSWIGLRILAVNGSICCIDEPLVLYRQHSFNVFGAHKVGGYKYYISKIKSVDKVIRSYYNNYKMVKDIVHDISWFKFLAYRCLYLLKR